MCFSFSDRNLCFHGSLLFLKVVLHGLLCSFCLNLGCFVYSFKVFLDNLSLSLEVLLSILLRLLCFFLSCFGLGCLCGQFLFVGSSSFFTMLGTMVLVRSGEYTFSVCI